ncbi:hypothetical protein DWU98_09310 [Dyella monticola]|uniref:Uncharacterized protein n=1 Tax=Dyella monticola TaxID=1927958 RepID=A0A370X1Y7_9GAMM|nr:hypothetical protein [Dyella monticola]RDS82225.1 hypothetical protein DWU98_09310 [Dyella monticola]
MMVVMRFAATTVGFLKVGQGLGFRQRWGVLLLAGVLAGCANTPWPRAPDLDQSTLVANAKSVGQTPSKSIQTVDDAKLLIDALDRQLQHETDTRRETELAFDDASFFGALAAVGGIAGKSIAARNIGGGIAGLSAAISGHYNPKAQRIAFTQAWAQTRCLKSALNGIDTDTYNTFQKPLGSVGDTTTGAKAVSADQAYSNIPQITYDRVGDIVFQLINGLDNIETSTPSLSDIRSVAMQVSDAAKSANGAPAAVEQKYQEQIVTAQANVQAAQDAVNKAKQGGKETALLDSSLQIARNDLSQLQKAANQNTPAQTAFLSAVVQYEASAQACVKLTSTQ